MAEIHTNDAREKKSIFLAIFHLMTRGSEHWWVNWTMILGLFGAQVLFVVLYPLLFLS